jgi:hypothetical protein
MTNLFTAHKQLILTSIGLYYFPELKTTPTTRRTWIGGKPYMYAIAWTTVVPSTILPERSLKEAGIPETPGSARARKRRGGRK